MRLHQQQQRQQQWCPAQLYQHQQKQLLTACNTQQHWQRLLQLPQLSKQQLPLQLQ